MNEDPGIAKAFAEQWGDFVARKLKEQE